MTSYQITEELYVKAMSYAQRRRQSIIVGVCLIVPMILYATKGFDRQVLTSVLVVYIIFAFYFLVLMPAINRMNFKRTYRNNPLLHKTQHFELSETQVRFKSENGESCYPLDEIRKLVILPELVMFYPTTTIFHVIPRDALSESELQTLSRLVQP